MLSDHQAFGWRVKHLAGRQLLGVIQRLFLSPEIVKQVSSTAKSLMRHFITSKT